MRLIAFAPSLLLLASACGRIGFAESVLGTGAGDPPRAGASPGQGGADSGQRSLSDGGSWSEGGPGPSDGGTRSADDASTDASTELDASIDVPPTPPLDCSTIQDAIVCEGFEALLLPASIKKDIEAGAIGVVNGSLVSVIAGASARAAVVWSLPAITAGTYYLRIAMTVPAAVPIDELNFAALASGGKGKDKGKDIDFNLIDDTAFEVYLIESESRVEGAFMTPRGQRMCMRSELVIDPSAGSITAQIDGSQALSFSMVDTLPGKAISELRVGIDFSSPDQLPATLLIHDVVLATTDPGPCL